MIKKIISVIIAIVIIVVLAVSYVLYGHFNEKKVLEQIIERLEADTRIAEVLVVESKLDENTNKVATTIKFLEYNTQGQPLKPRYFTFHGNVIQFQSLVIRFKDDYIKQADKMHGKSAHLFLKAFVLDGESTQEYEITPYYSLPDGYAIEKASRSTQEKIWRSFWHYALEPGKVQESGIKNAQIEAPGTVFLPGTLYTLKIEHDGGIRIDAQKLPEILKGETIE